MSDEQQMPAAIRFVANDAALAVEPFLALVQRVWPGAYDPDLARRALRRKINVTPWDGDHLVGCVRLPRP